MGGHPTLSPVKFRALLKRFSQSHLLVVGDLMLDRFIWGDVDRISPEAPVPVVRVTSESLRLGGAANVIHNIRALGGNVTACGLLGQDEAGKWLERRLRSIGSSTRGIVASPALRTTEKSRVIARPRHQQLVRLDHENHEKIPVALLDKLCGFIERHGEKYDGIVISDYGKGTIQPELLKLVSRLGTQKRILTVVDPKRENFSNYRDVTLVTPNTMEASEASGVEIVDSKTLREAGRRLLDKWRAEVVLITQGQQGMSLFRKNGPVGSFPTTAREVFDVTGAGDTVVATCALALACRGTYEEAAILGNLAAGSVVGELGTVAVSVDRLKESLELQRVHRESEKPGGSL